MASRVGIDLVAVESVREALRDHGEHYLRRIYTDREIADCTDGGEPAADRLAARFAAKEAAIKALRPSRDQALAWRSIEVVRGAAGWVELQLSGSAAVYAEESGVAAFALSFTHEGAYAAAVVVAELVAPG